MNGSEAGILLLTGIMAGTMNGIVGGGTFLVFPVLIFLGLPPIAANASATVATFPGTLAAMVGYRQELWALRQRLPVYIAVSLTGGAIGAGMLLLISNTTFSRLVPYLLLLATLVFSFRGTLIGWIHDTPHDGNTTRLFRWILGFLFVAICIYGGFFGAGMGIMMMALLGVMGMSNILAASALRACVGLFSNAVAVVIFVLAGLVYWPQVLVMMAGIIVGSYGSVRFFRRLPARLGHNVVMLIAWSMTTYFFIKMLVVK